MLYIRVFSKFSKIDQSKTVHSIDSLSFPATSLSKEMYKKCKIKITSVYTMYNLILTWAFAAYFNFYGTQGCILQ